VVRERERGNMELLIATPVSRSELMVGKVLPYAAIGLLQTTLVLVLGTWLFQVPIRGSLLDIYLAAVLLVLANLALGLLISTRARSQFQAMQMTLFLFLPSILLSGFMFPFAGMPRPVQWLAECRDPLPAPGARHHAARCLAVGAVARRAGAAGLHRGDDDPGHPAFPQAPGLVRRSGRITR
jgi:hypothetical protein